jgi:hypothetical protein
LKYLSAGPHQGCLAGQGNVQWDQAQVGVKYDYTCGIFPYIIVGCHLGFRFLI